MKPETAEIVWLDSHESVSFAELVELSGLDEADMQALVEHGLFMPVERHTLSLTFSADCIAAARTAARLRQDLGLDIDGLALAMTLLDRIKTLEVELRTLQALVPRWLR